MQLALSPSSRPWSGRCRRRDDDGAAGAISHRIRILFPHRRSGPRITGNSLRVGSKRRQYHYSRRPRQWAGSIGTLKRERDGTVCHGADVRARAPSLRRTRRPRQPSTPMMVPSTKDTIANTRWTTKNGVAEPSGAHDWLLAHRFRTKVIQMTHDHTPKINRNNATRRDMIRIVFKRETGMAVRGRSDRSPNNAGRIRPIESVSSPGRHPGVH